MKGLIAFAVFGLVVGVAWYAQRRGWIGGTSTVILPGPVGIEQLNSLVKEEDDVESETG